MESSRNSLANNDLEFRLPYNSNVWTNSSSWSTTDDAVYGNDFSEQFGATGLTTDSEYKAAVEKAIREGEYRRIVLTHDITDLSISRPVNIDLNGYGLYGTTRASFTDGATCHIYNEGKSNCKDPYEVNASYYANETQVSVVKNLDINTANADWIIESDGTNADAERKGAKGAADSKTSAGLTVDEVVLRAIPAKTLTNTTTIGKITVNSGSRDVKIVNAKDSNGDSGRIDEIVLDNVNKNGTVKLRNFGDDDAIETVIVNSPVKIDVAKDSDDKEIEKYKDLSLKKIKEISVNATKDVELKMDPGTARKVTGTTKAVTFKNEDGDVVDGIKGVKVEADTKQGVVDLLKGAFVNSASVETVSSAAITDILVNKDGTVDKKNNSAVKGYDVMIQVNSGDKQPLGLASGETDDTSDKKFNLRSSIEWNGLKKGTNTVTILIKKTNETLDKAIPVKDIILTVKN